jgi:hypothetical protein
VAVIFEVLFGMQTAASTATTTGRFALDASGFFAGTEPGFPDLGSQKVIRVELGAGLCERRRRDDRAGFGLRGIVGIVIERNRQATG